MLPRRTFLRASVASLAAALVPPARSRAEPAPRRRARDASAALCAAAHWLAERQSPDGGWRSATYGAMRDGIVLTAPAGKVVLEAARMDPRLRPAGDAALNRLARTAPAADEGPILDFPVYAASMAAIAIARHARDEADLAARDRWLAFLRRHQLDDALGWRESDLDWGGFGYAPRPPRPPANGDLGTLPFTGDLSSTTFALGALALAGDPRDAERLARGRAFVERCQNLPGDGGFFTSPSHPLQNKAGMDESVVPGRPRSYGSATADGIRALLRCGAMADDRRLLAASTWLRHRLPEALADRPINPGDFAPERRAEQPAGALYFAWSAGHALRGLRHALAEEWIEVAAADLSARLVALQAADGSWRNPHPFMREDDPLIATALAAGAVGALAA